MDTKQPVRKQDIMKTTLTIIALAVASFAAQAQQTTTVEGDNLGKIDQQNIGDSLVQDVRTNSTSTQLGNSANANGASISVPTNVDTRDQNTVALNPTTTSAGGAATGNHSDNANQSSAATGASSSGGNTVAGQNTSTNTNAGGSASAGGGAGGQGGASSAQGGTSGATATGGAGAAGNSAVRVDASDRSTTNYTSRATVLPPTVHGAAAPPLAVGHMAVVSTPCGPRVGIVRRDIVGKRFGVWGGQQDVLQGQDEITAPAAQPFVVVDGYLLGHIVTTYTTTVGTSSAGSFSVGGYGKSGEGAQGGGAASGQMQQIVQRVVVTECLMPVAAPAPVVLQQVYAPEPQRAVPRQDRN